MKTAKEIKDGMAQFYGTQTYRWFHPMVPNVLLTDGASYIAEECASYWLMNLIASYTPMIKDEFAVIELLKNGDEARVIIADDKPPTKLYAKQEVATDFPLDTLTLYAQFDGEHWVIMLPSEY